MPNVVWFQLLKCKGLLLLFFLYDSKLDVIVCLDFWSDKTKSLIKVIVIRSHKILTIGFMPDKCILKGTNELIIPAFISRIKKLHIFIKLMMCMVFF